MLYSKHRNILLLIFLVFLVIGLGILVFKLNGYFAEAKVRNAIEEANYCSKNDDCVLIGSKCPFGCYVAVNKEKADEINELISNYKSNCVYGCVEVSGTMCQMSKCQIVRADQVQRVEGFIRGVSISPKYLEIDEIQFLSGKEAIEQVILDTGCSRDKIYECAPSMNNDFYISNPVKDTKKYSVSDLVKLQIMRNPGSPVLSEASFDNFAQFYNRGELLLNQLPFNFQLQNGVITNIEEQYTP